MRNRLEVPLPGPQGGYLDVAPNDIWDERYWVVEPKYDGVRVSVELGATVKLTGKNRESGSKKYRDLTYYNPSICKELASADLAGTMLDGEITEIFKINGTLDKNTQTKITNNEPVGIWVWDILFYKGQDIRSWPDHRRRALLVEVVNKISHPRLKTVPRFPASKETMNGLMAQGHEGVVVKCINTCYPSYGSHHPDWYKIKWADNRTVDVIVTGFEVGKDDGVVSARVALRNGTAMVPVGVARNLPYQVTDYGYTEAAKFIGNVMECHVAGWSGGKLRQARFHRWRDDKSPEQCQVSHQIGQAR